MNSDPTADPRITIVEGDITHLAVDAIVNAANESLEPGGGVCGAIHRAAGPELAEECRTLAPCPTGEARITSGYRLSAKFVVHAVGPVWHGGEYNEDALLASAYREALTLAEQAGSSSIAFPAISTGIFGYPAERATEIAYKTVRRFLDTQPLPDRVVFCCFDKTTAEIYRRIAARVSSGGA